MERAEALKRLLNFEGKPSEIVRSLGLFGWDSEDELVILSRGHIASVLQRYLNSKLASVEVEDWANAIEGREDIGYEKGCEELLNETIFQLANPVLAKELDDDFANELIRLLG